MVGIDVWAYSTPTFTSAVHEVDCWPDGKETQHEIEYR